MSRGRRVIGKRYSVIRSLNKLPSLHTLWFAFTIALSILLITLGGARMLEADRVAVGVDPLNSAEIDSLYNSTRHDTRIASNSAILLIERHRESKQTQQRGSWRRRADVYLYDYDSDQLTIALVDVESGVVESLSQASGVQLPLTDFEIERAAEIVMADVEVWAEISAEIDRLTGSPAMSLHAVDVKAFTFLASTLPHRVNAAAETCGQQRCAQLLLYTTDDIALDLMPIVNLSTGDVAQVMGLVADAPHFHLGGEAHEH